MLVACSILAGNGACFTNSNHVRNIKISISCIQNGRVLWLSQFCTQYKAERNFKHLVRGGIQVSSCANTGILCRLIPSPIGLVLLWWYLLALFSQFCHCHNCRCMIYWYHKSFAYRFEKEVWWRHILWFEYELKDGCTKQRRRYIWWFCQKCRCPQLSTKKDFPPDVCRSNW